VREPSKHPIEACSYLVFNYLKTKLGYNATLSAIASFVYTFYR